MFGFTKKRIYLDYASATPVLQEAVDAMRDAEKYTGNPGAIHGEGVEAARALEDARVSIAEELQCKPRELFFTSGLTEANTLAIVGFARSLEQKRRTLADTHWVVSALEHPAVLASFAEVERMGGSVTHVLPTPTGRITVEAIMAAVTPATVCVSVGWANSETGTVQPVRDIVRALREYEEKNRTHIFFHSDAGQAPLYLYPHVNMLGVDAMAFGGNKLYGPHGIGALYLRDASLVMRTLFGGGQEKGLRPGTESVALALGFAAAVKKVGELREHESERLQELRDELVKGIQEIDVNLCVNTDLKHALPHMLNVSFPHVAGEYLTLSLDKAGIAVSTKSACREGESTVSHVVQLLNISVGEEWRARNTIRFSLGKETTHADIQNVIKACGLFCGSGKTQSDLI